MPIANEAIQALINKTAQQEKDLVFKSFDMADAWEIGQMIRKRILAYGGDAAIDITVNGLQLFHCVAGHPVPHNTTWIGRKRNIVLEYWESSYRVTQELLLSGKTLEERGLSTKDYALSGGGFPIRVENLGVVGTVVVSGLPQTHDHQFIVDAIAEFLGVKTVSILE